MKKKKRRIANIKLPDTYVILMIIILLASLLTYIVPAGIYDTIEGTRNVDPRTFHFVDKAPVGFFEAINSIYDGMVKSAKIIFSVIMISGAFKLINDTAAIENAIDFLSKKLEDRVVYIIPVIMVFMSILGYFGIIVNQTIVFIPIGLLIARKLKMDPIVGLSMMYLATYSGFIGSGMDPFTIIIAQEISGLKLLSGIVFRTIVFVFMLVAAIVYLMSYAKKVRGKAENSVLAVKEYDWAIDIKEERSEVFTRGQKLILILLISTFILYIVAVLNWSWGMRELTSLMLILAITSGLINKMNFDAISRSFVEGCKMAVYSAILIGFATAISVILSKANIIHTIIHYASMPLAYMSSYLSALFMFAFNWVFNLFVPSGSGQAVVVMPILAPLSEIVGLSKQVTVSAYKYGDGITNLIIPTSGTLMGFIGLARVPYDKWLKFIMPLVGIWTGICGLALLVGVAIGW